MGCVVGCGELYGGLWWVVVGCMVGCGELFSGLFGGLW